MRVLVTGSRGFIGKNLISHLSTCDDIEIVTYDKEDAFEKIENNINNIDFIFHLAGINRPQTKEEFYTGNSDLTKKIVDLIKDKNIPLLITSSIQASLDNDYGKSKRIAEDYIKDNLQTFFIYRLHNVFGKWCRPNYNSVVATFCYNVAHGLEISVDDPAKEISLIYIDDVIREFMKVLRNKNNTKQPKEGYYTVYPQQVTTIGQLAEKIKDFSHDVNSVFVPKTGDAFTKKLFSTFISYVETEDLIFSPQVHSDERGVFAELIKTIDSGQVSISTSKPGIIRGNHYHHTKIERFIVLSGVAEIHMQHIITGEQKLYKVSGDKLQIITIPVGFTHNIKNVGKEEMVLMIWCNEIFNADEPDTFYKIIEE